MAFPDLRRGSMLFHIAVAGPARAGRTTTLMRLGAELTGYRVAGIFKRPMQDGGCAVQLELESSRECPSGFRQCRYIVHSLPAAARYERTRRFLLAAADAVVFVADSQWIRMLDNERALQQLAGALRRASREPGHVPVILQFNKRDLPEIAPTEYMDYLLNRGVPRATWLESTATEGRGLSDMFEAVRLHLFTAAARCCA